MKMIHVVLLVGLIWSAGVLAHSEQQQSLPEDGAHLAISPEQIKIGFDAPMRIISVKLTDAAGQQYSVAPESGRAATQVLMVKPPRLPAGDYVFEWRGIATDGHAMAGELSFSVQSR